MIADICKRIADRNTPLENAFGLCGTAIDNELFTAMRFHADTMEVERLYSTLPVVYPVSGRKPKRDTAWGDKVLVHHQINNGFGADDIEWAFSDHETILGLGLNAVLNVPIVDRDTVLGTINFLRGGRPFNNQEVAIGQQLAAALGSRTDYLELPTSFQESLC
tara:strand:- start:73357 stop:73845 length:489 start_codon:yes stop_codon:yes gene_type:complete